ncbi:MAG: undecaprenyldiphospho-muramoylpentapeptide beta-N-acetylglucosaminyltransferase [Rhodobacteraceae bacterium]|nr:undecaprenyldiphospho-muramoylpentapeptide beta-N-acetylglucosaminyltransferase [Paracoccaceae bacterium]
MKKKRILLAAGGTGGHMFPAQALSEVLLKDGWTVGLSTDVRGSRFLDSFPSDIKVAISDSGTFSSSGIIKKISTPWRIIKGTISTLINFKRERPDVIVGFGGYPSIPALLTARLLGIPFILHEQNGILGLVNKIFSKYANVVACGTWPTSAPEKTNLVFTGNPVRASILKRSGSPYICPGDYPMSLVVVGGSQGATVLSKIVPIALSKLPPEILKNLRVSHQARSEDIIAVSKCYESMGVQAFVKPFFDDIPSRYSEAQLVISRSGASSVADISIIGRPSILIPFAAAIADHQSANASQLNASGGAIVIQESELTSEKLATKITQILMFPEVAQEMANQAFKCGNPNAVEKLQAVVKSVVDGTSV